MGAALSYGLEKSSADRLPPLDGPISLSCLDQPGSIKYDKWGIPHIYATSRKDGYRLLGFVTAQHRCFQLVQMWLAIHGKLSSVVGPAALPVDIFSKTCNFKGLAQDDWNVLLSQKEQNPKCIEAITGYVEGINGWLTHSQFVKPVELSTVILNYDPELWTPEDVCGVSRLLAIKMSHGWASKMIATLLIQIVGYENAQWFC